MFITCDGVEDRNDDRDHMFTTPSRPWLIQQKIYKSTDSIGKKLYISETTLRNSRCPFYSAIDNRLSFDHDMKEYYVAPVYSLNPKEIYIHPMMQIEVQYMKS